MGEGDNCRALVASTCNPAPVTIHATCNPFCG